MAEGSIPNKDIYLFLNRKSRLVDELSGSCVCCVCCVCLCLFVFVVCLCVSCENVVSGGAGAV